MSNDDKYSSRKSYNRNMSSSSIGSSTNKQDDRAYNVDNYTEKELMDSYFRSIEICNRMERKSNERIEKIILADSSEDESEGEKEKKRSMLRNVLTHLKSLKERNAAEQEESNKKRKRIEMQEQEECQKETIADNTIFSNASSTDNVISDNENLHEKKRRHTNSSITNFSNVGASVSIDDQKSFPITNDTTIHENNEGIENKIDSDSGSGSDIDSSDDEAVHKKLVERRKRRQEQQQRQKEQLEQQKNQVSEGENRNKIQNQEDEKRDKQQQELQQSEAQVNHQSEQLGAVSKIRKENITEVEKAQTSTGLTNNSAVTTTDSAVPSSEKATATRPRITAGSTGAPLPNDCNSKTANEDIIVDTGNDRSDENGVDNDLASASERGHEAGKTQPLDTSNTSNDVKSTPPASVHQSQQKENMSACSGNEDKSHNNHKGETEGTKIRQKAVKNDKTSKLRPESRKDITLHVNEATTRNESSMNESDESSIERFIEQRKERERPNSINKKPKNTKSPDIIIIDSSDEEDDMFDKRIFSKEPVSDEIGSSSLVSTSENVNADKPSCCTEKRTNTSIEKSTKEQSLPSTEDKNSKQTTPNTQPIDGGSVAFGVDDDSRGKNNFAGDNDKTHEDTSVPMNYKSAVGNQNLSNDKITSPCRSMTESEMEAELVGEIESNINKCSAGNAHQSKNCSDTDTPETSSPTPKVSSTVVTELTAATVLRDVIKNTHNQIVEGTAHSTELQEMNDDIPKMQIKPLFKEGDEVRALHSKKNKYLVGTVEKYTTFEPKDKKYGLVRYYRIKFEGQDYVDNLHEVHVFRQDEFLSEGQWKDLSEKYELQKNHDKESKDKYARVRGWFCSKKTGDEVFPTLIDAVRRIESLPAQP